MDKNIAVVFRNFKMNNGGTVSAMELVEAMADQNRVCIVLLEINFKNLLNVARLKRRFKIFIIPGFESEIKFFKRKVPGSSIMNFIWKGALNLFFSKRQIKTFKKELAQTDYLIFTTLVKDDFHEKLSYSDRTKLVMNHNGSPSTFVDYWMGSVQESEYRYRQQLERFNVILFQARLQLEETLRVNPLIQEKCKLVRPTCNEVKISRAKAQKNIFDRKHFNLIMVGSIQDRKDQLRAIKLMGKLILKTPLIRLHILGGFKRTDSYFQRLIAEIDKTGLTSSVKFYNHISSHLDYLVSADAILSTSKSEGVPRALREAMFARIPIICSRLPGNVDLLGDHGALYLNDNDSFSASLIAENLEHLDKFSKEAFKLYQERNSKKVFENSVNEVFG